MAREKGITEEQIGTVLSVVMAISACGISNRSKIGDTIPENQKKAFSDFYKSTEQNDFLDSRITLFVQIAAALANGCPT
ncbi:MAG: hypothetical protein JSV53_01245 [candidate division WOR-3 bacterium]|nr:MAG: hypothetical protein JSV53_01245 [candidate division WOR-3 bacterium]